MGHALPRVRVLRSLRSLAPGTSHPHLVEHKGLHDYGGRRIAPPGDALNPGRYVTLRGPVFDRSLEAPAFLGKSLEEGDYPFKERLQLLLRGLPLRAGHGFRLGRGREDRDSNPDTGSALSPPPSRLGARY